MDPNDHIKYTAEDILRYQRGEMTAAEMHAMEKAALDDPFLADAMEGYAFSSSPEAEIKKLKERLNERTKREKAGVIPFTRTQMFRVAAMIILIAGLGWIAFNLPLNDNKKEVAKAPVSNSAIPGSNYTLNQDSAVTATADTIVNAETRKVEKQVFFDDPGSATDKATWKNKEEEPAKGTFAAASKKNPVNKGLIDNNDVAHYRGNKFMKVYKERDSLAKADDAKTEVEQTEVVSAPPVQNTYNNGVYKSSALSNVLSGNVRKDNGEPVPFASVTMLNNANGVAGRTQTDVNGYFMLRSTDTTAVVSVTAVGLENNKAILNSGAKNEIVLKESNAQLSEVVVTKSNARRKQVSGYIVESGELEPEEGWPQFNDYLAEKLKAKKDNSDAKLAGGGEVELAFEVNARGEPVNITVQNSNCEACNEEAIRLLKEGPKWKRKKGKKGKISIKF